MSLGLVLDGGEGENKEFGVDGTKTVNININDSDNTSANDTDTEKYFDIQLTSSEAANCGSARAFFLRNDQTIQILSINNITFTDPITVTDNKGHREEFNQPIIFKITIKTTLSSGSTTNIKLRVK